MNKTYKVRATRTGALQVVSELTSSVTSFGTKTVLAAAMGAAFAGAAVAATPDWTANDVVIDQEVTVSTGTNFNDSLTIKAGGHLTLKDVGMDVTSGKKGDFTIEQGGKLTVQGDASNGTDQTLNAKNVKITGGEISISGGTDAWQQHASLGGYNTFEMSGGTVTLGDNARLWIGSGGGTESTEGSTPTVTTLTEAMVFKGGDVFMKAGKGKHAIIGTMANGSWANPGTDPQYVQTLSLEGTNLHVDQGEGVLISRDIDMSAGTISVAKDAVLHVLSQKKLTKDDNTGVLVTETNDLTGTFDITGGTVSIAEGGTMNVRTAMTIGGGDTTATVSNAGFFGAYSRDGITIAKNGVFHSTVLNGDTFAAAKITLEEGGVLSMDKLNSNQEGFGPALLVSGNKTTALQVELKGGDIRVGGQSYHGDIKIGEATDKGAVTISSGSYRTSSVRFGSATGNSLTIGANGALDVTKLDLTYGKITNNGSLTIGSVVTGETLAAENVTNAETGTIYTTMDVLATSTTEGSSTTWAKTLFGTAIAGDAGKIVETGHDGKYTLEQLGKIQASEGGLGLTNFSFANATLVADAEKGGNVDFEDLVGEGAPSYVSTNSQVDATVTGTTATVSMGESTSTIRVGSINAGNTATTLGIAGVAATAEQGSLTIGGAGGELFAGSALKTVQLTGKVTLGVEGTTNTVSQQVVIGTPAETDSIMLYADEITNVVTVDSDTNFNKGVQIASADSQLVIAETAAVTVQKGLTFGTGVTGNPESVLASGDLTVDWMQDKAGYVVLENGGAFALLGTKEGQDAYDTDYNGSVVLGMIKATGTEGMLLSFGATLDAARAATEQYQSEDGKKNFIYIAKQIDNNGSEIELDGAEAVLDLAGIASTSGWDASEGVVNGSFTATTPADATIHLQNLTAAALTGEAGSKSLKLGKETSSEGIVIDYGTIFYGAYDEAASGTAIVYGANLNVEDGKATSLTTIGKVTDGAVSFAPNEDALKAVENSLLGDAIKSAVENVSFGQNALVDAIVFGLDDQYVAAYNEAIAQKMTAEQAQTYAAEKVQAALETSNEASVMGVLGGAFNVALDANAEVTKALDRRMSVANGLGHSPAAASGYGVNAWVDVIGTTNEAKRLYGSGMGYEADLYGAVLGADWTAPCGAIIGAALSVGTADSNSVGQSGSKIENDADFWGFSIYGAHHVGMVNGKFDIGYVSTSNDLSTNVLGQKIKESLDADVFTVGLGAELLAKAGSVNVVPHAGVRFTKVDLDDGKYGASYDAMNVWQMPVGVTFSGSFEEAGWKFAPMLDLSVVPAFGDKDAVVTVAGNSEAFRVVDTNPIQATLGLSAEQGAWTFGVHYGLTAGGSDRMNNAFNATAKYAF